MASRVLVPQKPHRTGTNRRGIPTWQLSVHVGTHHQTGKRIQKLRRFAGPEREAKQAAAAFAAELTSQIDTLLGVGDEDVLRRVRVDPQVTFGKLVEKHYYPAQFKKWKPSVRLQRRRDIDNKLKPRAIWTMRVRAIEPVDIDDLFEDLREHGREDGGPLADISPITQIVSGAMKLAKRKGVRKDDPSEDADGSGAAAPRKRNSAGIAMKDFIDAWTKAQELSPRVGAILGCEICSGVRRSELVGLRWPDFDPVAQQLRVVAPVTYGLDDHGVQRLCTNNSTKTHAAERIVKLGWDAVRMMMDHRAWCEEEAMRNGTTLRPDGYIFSPVPDGSQAFWPTSIDRLVRELCRHVGLPRTLELQGLRGLVSSLLLANGVDKAAYAAQQGHSVTTALRFYAYASDEQKMEAAEGLSATIAGFVAANRTGDPTEAEAKLLNESSGMLAKLDSATAEQTRRALRFALAQEESRIRAVEAAAARKAAVDLAERRDRTPASMALQIAHGLRTTGSFRVQVKDIDEGKAWRKEARWVSRGMLRQPVRTKQCGLLVIMDLQVPVDALDPAHDDVLPKPTTDVG